MALTQAPVGFVRDEGYYFTAAQSYESWLRLLLQSPLQAIAQTERYWSYNFEHPASPSCSSPPRILSSPPG